MTEEPATAGLFGKLPGHGDFVDRGLPPAFRKLWDQWITRHIAPRQRDGARFPARGLRFRLVSGGATAAGLILPSHDSADRLFPLSLMVIGDGAIDVGAIDLWCDAALLLPVGGMDADGLWQALDTIPAPGVGDVAGPTLLDLWAEGVPQVAMPDDPDAATALIHRLLPV